MRKYLSRIIVLLALGALVAVPTAALAGYKVPKPSGGSKSSKAPAKAAGKKIQNSTLKQDKKGVKVGVKEKKPGKLTVTLSHNGTKIGGGSVKYTKPATKTLKITFNSKGKSLLKSKHAAGTKIKLKSTFKPKHGKTSTSTETVKLG